MVSQREARRLRVVSWNTWGLTGPRYSEMLEWLRQEELAGRTVDKCVLQETAWRQDMEYNTQVPGEETSGFHAILCLIRRGLLPPTSIRSVARDPGRLLHIRLLVETPLDILCVYQTAWNPHKSTLKGDKIAMLMKQRQRTWTGIDQWIRSVPQRNGCLLVGDFNTPLQTEGDICGPGVAQAGQHQQQDQAELQATLRVNHCSALNTWRGRGAAARTYIPPKASEEQQGTQVDFIIARGHLIDDVAKRSMAFKADFVPSTGCRHKPVTAMIRLPLRRRSIREAEATMAQAHKAI